jgi:hypothetical protein
MARWGFQHKTVLTWVKPRWGLGSYFRNATEHVLFGVRGELRTRSDSIATHFEAALREHSEKPDRFYEIVREASYPPYCEVFQREARPGFANVLRRWSSLMPSNQRLKDPRAGLEDVRQQAERTIILASERVGAELAATPVATGTRGTARGSTNGSGGILKVPPESTPTLADQVGSKNRGLRLKKLATVGARLTSFAHASLGEGGKSDECRGWARLGLSYQPPTARGSSSPGRDGHLAGVESGAR